MKVDLKRQIQALDIPKIKMTNRPTLSPTLKVSTTANVPTPVVDALAAYRLTRLLTQDRLTEAARDRVPEYPFGCHWCMGVWVSAGVVAARRHIPRYWGPVADVLAIAAVAGIISDLMYEDDEPFSNAAHPYGASVPSAD